MNQHQHNTSPLMLQLGLALSHKMNSSRSGDTAMHDSKILMLLSHCFKKHQANASSEGCLIKVINQIGRNYTIREEALNLNLLAGVESKHRRALSLNSQGFHNQISGRSTARNEVSLHDKGLIYLKHYL